MLTWLVFQVQVVQIRMCFGWQWHVWRCLKVLHTLDDWTATAPAGLMISLILWKQRETKVLQSLGCYCTFSLCIIIIIRRRRGIWPSLQCSTGLSSGPHLKRAGVVGAPVLRRPNKSNNKSNNNNQQIGRLLSRFLVSKEVMLINGASTDGKIGAWGHIKKNWAR